MTYEEKGSDRTFEIQPRIISENGQSSCLSNNYVKCRSFAALRAGGGVTEFRQGPPPVENGTTNRLAFKKDLG